MGWRLGLGGAGAPLLLLLLLAGPGSGGRKYPKRKCPGGCTCFKDTAICERVKEIPRDLPQNLFSLSLIRSGFTEILAGSFQQVPSLQLLLITYNSLELIGDDAFVGLIHLEYLFIEQNRLEAISKNAFRGLKNLLYLNLANNNLQTLPRNLFQGLDALTSVDLRGNAFHCDCKLKWLVEWLGETNAQVEPMECRSPPELNRTKISELRPAGFNCITTDLVLFDTLPEQSLSVETFMNNKEQNLVIAQPFTGRCSFLEWDHVAGKFRTYASINGPEEPKVAKKQPSKKGLTRCFQIVSAHVFGPMPKSLGKAKYYLLITDHFSKYTWFYPLQKPQQAIVKFSEFHAKVELKHGCKIECLLTNDIPLFTSQEFQVFFDDKGIHHKFAKTQAAWDKSLCVKVNTELEAGMQAQLLSSGLSEQLWAESISFFLYQWLRQVPKGQKRSPYEILFQQKPDVSNTKVFGTKMWVASLEGKPVQGILLGFEEGQCRVMLLSSNEVILTQEVEHTPTPQETYVLDEFPIGANDFDDSYTDTSCSDNDSFAEGSTPSSSDTGETVIHKGTHAVFNRPSSDDEKVLEALDPLFTIGKSSPKSPEGENLSKQDLHLSRRSERIRRGPKRYSQEFANTAIANLAVLRTPKQAAVTQAKPQQQVVKRNTVSVNRATALVPWKPKLVNPVSESSTAGKSYFVYDNCLFTSLNDALTFASFSISGFRGDVSINPLHGTDAACG